MAQSGSTAGADSDQHIDQVRTLILGENSHVVTETIKKEARNIVGDVLPEALHDRQKKDGSVNKVLLPLVEDAVEHSVSHHSDRLVGSLYPLMGSLVRKAVTAFLTDFMEKTNQLIENSLTIKGLKWRVRAWQAGVSFAQYVASQTFVYRVEHVFLIHRETGLLLNAIDLNNQSKQDADLISSMLTAINDFVGDSFTADEYGFKEQLQTVTTDTFNLLIKPGPHALVVAAVIGTPPQSVNDQLQLTLEEVHSLYIDELNQFSGDSSVFENAENQLRDCLLFEQKTNTQVRASVPWFAWALLVIVLCLSGYYSVQWWRMQQLNHRIWQLDSEPGIIIQTLAVESDQRVRLALLRDPDAIAVKDWLAASDLDIDISDLDLLEKHYQSLDLPILKARSQRILTQYPQIKAHWQEDMLQLSGQENRFSIDAIQHQLAVAGLVAGKNLDLSELRTFKPAMNGASDDAKWQVFKQIIGRISSIQLSFEPETAKLTESMYGQLSQLYQQWLYLAPLAEELGLNCGLIIIGSSDSTGVTEKNHVLSFARANNAAKALRQIGMNEKKVFVAGLGQIDITGVEKTSRKVMFNVLYVEQ